MSSPAHHAQSNSSTLRRGWTTGACATAAMKAALTGLITGCVPDTITITLPKNKTPRFAITHHTFHHDGSVSASVIKDAGDDPDVTHHAEIVARVRPTPPGTGTTFTAGHGVGTITKAGLPLPVGEPAINPGPRAQMHTAINELHTTHHCGTDYNIEISVPTGLDLAPQTWNPRLGILGGISILGTTGVVIPYSCSAWMDSIHRGIDVAKAAGLHHVVGSVGHTSETAAMNHLKLPTEAYLDMGDFVGAVLNYLRKHPVQHLTIAGGFAKLSKLADGHLDLHSGRSQVNLAGLAKRAADLGAAPDLCTAITHANTALEALKLSQRAHIDLAASVARAAAQFAKQRLHDAPVTVHILVTDRNGTIIATA